MGDTAVGLDMEVAGMHDCFGFFKAFFSVDAVTSHLVTVEHTIRSQALIATRTFTCSLRLSRKVRLYLHLSTALSEFVESGAFYFGWRPSQAALAASRAATLVPTPC